MKKICLALVVLAMLCGLCACISSDPPPTRDEPSAPTSNAPSTTAPDESDSLEPVIEAIPIHIGESINHQNFLMTFDSMELLDEYSYSTGEHSTRSLYVEDGYKILAIKGHFENKSTAAIPAYAFLCTTVVNDSYEVDNNDVRLNFIRNNSSEIDAYTDLDYILYTNIPEKLAEMFDTATFTIGFKDDLSLLTTTFNSDGTRTTDIDNLYELTSGLSANSNSESIQEIAIGDMITTDEYEFTLQSVDLTYELLPSNTSSVYTSYPAEQGKVYVHVAATLKNLMKRDIRIDETFSVKALYGDDYIYNGFVVVDTGNQFDWVSSYSAATPLETANIHGLIECPIEVDSTDEKLVVMIKMSNDTEYQYTIR